VCTSKVQDALTKVTGVSEVVSVSMEENKAVVKVEKDKVENDALVKAVTDAGPFSAQIAN
jgi:copper chaperone CopZ